MHASVGLRVSACVLKCCCHFSFVVAAVVVVSSSLPKSFV